MTTRHIAAIACAILSLGAAQAQAEPVPRHPYDPSIPFCSEVGRAHRPPCVVTCTNCAEHPEAMRALVAEFEKAERRLARQLRKGAKE